MEYMFLPLRRYADFSGRSRRQEYWLFILALFGYFFVSFLMLGFLAESAGDAEGIFVTGLTLVLMVSYLALVVPLLAVQVRRLHDQDRSGWLILLNFVPYVGWLILLVLMFIDGTPGPNRYGTDPKGRGETLANIFS